MKKVLSCIAVILVSVGNSVFAQNGQDDFSRAVELFQNGEYIESKAFFEKVLSEEDFTKFSIIPTLQNLYAVSVKLNDAGEAYKYGKMYLSSLVGDYGDFFSEEYLQVAPGVSQANDVYVSEIWYRPYYFDDSLSQVNESLSLYLLDALKINADAMKAFEESRYEDAIRLFETVGNMYKLNDLAESVHYAFASVHLGECYKRINEYGVAEKILRSTRLFYIQSGKIQEPGFAASNQLLSNIYEEQGQYVRSEALLYENVQLATLFNGEDSEEYFSAKLSLAKCLMHQYNYVDAIQIMEDLLYRWDGDVNHWIWGLLHLNYNILCLQLGQDEKVIKSCGEAVTPCESKEIFKEFAPAYHGILALVYSKRGLKTKAFSHANEAKNLDNVPDSLFRKAVEPLACLCLGSFYLYHDDVDQAIEWQERLVNLPPLGSTPLLDSEQIAKLGLLYSMSESNRDKSIPTVEMAIKMVEDEYGPEHPRFSEYLQQLLAIKHNLGCSISDDELKRFIQTSSNIIKSTSIFSVKERESFLEYHDQVNNLIFELGFEKGLYQQLFDYSALRKGFLLSSDLDFRQYYNNLPNSVLRAKYEKFCTLRALYANSMFCGQDSNLWGVDSSVMLRSFFTEPIAPDLYLEYKNLEIDILSEYKPNQVTYSSAVIAQSLKPHEVVVEFVNYIEGSMSNDPNSSDKEIYGAIILKSVNDKPVYTYIEIGDSEQFKAFVDNHNLYISNTQESRDFQKLFWNKIIAQIEKGSTIYFSPSGILYQLAIENTYVCNRTIGEEYYSLYRISSTRNFPLQPRFLKDLSTAKLYGGIDYENQAQLTDNVQPITEDCTSQIDTSIIRGSGITKWNYLPGTSKEIDSISKILKRYVSLTSYTKNQASESTIKSESGHSSNILHFATHGFYSKPKEENRKTFFNENVPLSRSGLIFSGANRAWSGEQTLDGRDDGILTSEEIANLDLSQTDLVILSACETGLGDITNEGVLGLQRGFKNAGVKTIIMSLWKIDDKVSSEFMKFFYDSFADGLSSQEAFRKAKNKIRANYPDPYYWAGFIMLD